MECALRRSPFDAHIRNAHNRLHSDVHHTKFQCEKELHCKIGPCIPLLTASFSRPSHNAYPRRKPGSTSPSPVFPCCTMKLFSIVPYPQRHYYSTNSTTHLFVVFTMEPSPDQNRLAVSHTEGDDELDVDIGILAAALSAAGSSLPGTRQGIWH